MKVSGMKPGENVTKMRTNHDYIHCPWILGSWTHLLTLCFSISYFVDWGLFRFLPVPCYYEDLKGLCICWHWEDNTIKCRLVYFLHCYLPVVTHNTIFVAIIISAVVGSLEIWIVRSAFTQQVTGNCMVHNTCRKVEENWTKRGRWTGRWSICRGHKGHWWSWNFSTSETR